ncbi:MAG: hypothetical protein M3N41_07875, partial [Acidobacteriota bacterium]|nr:hypothetical protein [Acidobacteriota bacterium]
MRILPAIALIVAAALAPAAQTAAPAQTPALTPPLKAVKKTAAKKAPKRPPVPRSAVSAATRSEAHEGVIEKVSKGAELPVENAAALVPFFEQLYRQQHGELSGPLRA